MMRVEATVLSCIMVIILKMCNTVKVLKVGLVATIYYIVIMFMDF